jgi:hypothetical protein
MKAAYIVVEGKENANFLKEILPESLLPEIEVIGMSSWYSAFSMAGTIMSERSRPVVLVVNAKSDDPDQIREEQQTLEGLLLPAASSEP